MKPLWYHHRKWFRGICRPIPHFIIIARRLIFWSLRVVSTFISWYVMLQPQCMVISFRFNKDWHIVNYWFRWASSHNAAIDNILSRDVYQSLSILIDALFTRQMQTKYRYGAEENGISGVKALAAYLTWGGSRYLINKPAAYHTNTATPWAITFVELIYTAFAASA